MSFVPGLLRCTISDVAVLQMFMHMYVVTVPLLLPCGFSGLWGHKNEPRAGLYILS